MVKCRAEKLKVEPYGTSAHQRKFRTAGKPRESVPLSSIKLAVALDLKAEGYIHIEFDRIFEFGSLKVKVHVLGEDEIGMRIAVFCINRLSQANLNEIFDDVELVRCNVEDCEIAFAFPVSLLPKAQTLIGFTSRLYMLDSEGRVWVHHPRSSVNKDYSRAILDHEESELVDNSRLINSSIKTAQVRLSYIA